MRLVKVTRKSSNCIAKGADVNAMDKDGWDFGHQTQ